MVKYNSTRLLPSIYIILGFFAIFIISCEKIPFVGSQEEELELTCAGCHSNKNLLIKIAEPRAVADGGG